MNSQDHLNKLKNMFCHYDWFDSVGIDKYGRYEIYVHYMNRNILELIPLKFENKPVLPCFVVAKPGTIKNRYVSEIDLKASKKLYQYDLDFDLPVSEPELDIDYLSMELDRLDKICRSDVVEHIFYEIHDQNNAITNYSVKYPEVRKSLEKLYQVYGFDLIYDEIG